MVAEFSLSQQVLQMLIPIVAILSYVALRLLISRYWIKEDSMRATLLSYSVGLFILGALHIFANSSAPWIASERLGFIIMNFLSYSSTALVFFLFANTGDTSVRIRILRELKASPNGLEVSELLRRYNKDHIISARVERMLIAGEMVSRDGRYYFTGKSKILFVARLFQPLKKVMFGKASFDGGKIESQRHA